ncbi:MAG: prenyltransferase [Candidatus Scalindua rubra]|uniref:Prenyltransferase n=1 Tax=Candidatus Scalindua rubra TaxID=1872076 RepID=A0A1E3X9M8_9BACT|nr:MAG: prenyltransferase [Candidatus Scalindua rubra]
MMGYQITKSQVSVDKEKKFVRENLQLLKGLNISTILSLARLHVYVPICFFSTTVGLDVTNRLHELASLFIIGLANTFALIATFAFNDAEDAPDDMLARSPKNVIALGRVSKGAGYLVAAVAAAISISLAIIEGITVCLIILAILITTFLYFWRRFRMKAMPFWDTFVHAVTGGLIFLSSAWSSQEGIIWGNQVLPICLIFSLGTMLALLVHGLYEYEDDMNANVRTTVVVLGKRISFWIVVGIFSLLTGLIINECYSGVFPLISIISFFIVVGTLILLSIMLFPKKAIYMSKRMVPWAVNSGAISTIIVWYLVK